MEALSLTRNEAFMVYLDAVSEVARNGQMYSLKEIRAEFNLPAKGRKRKKRPAAKS
ncbi:MAG: hypothetical protein AAB217_08240 [Chloroflexota bacterium]